MPQSGRYIDIPYSPRIATKVVAAVDADPEVKAQADFVCDGINDHVEIQAALDALPATGGEVRLLDGTYNIEVSLVLDSYQTLRGCGRNTILTTTTPGLDIITATGGAGSEKVGILIADLCIDGFAGGVANGDGIGWTYVDYSKIVNIWVRRIEGGTIWAGIGFSYCDFNELIGNTCQGNACVGIYLVSSYNNAISANICQGNGSNGIGLEGSYNNTVTGNNCQENASPGITISSSSDNNTVTGNICQRNGNYGIFINSSDNNTVTGNNCQENTHIGIDIGSSDSNTVTANICQKNGTHGIELGTSHHNIIMGNTCLENSQAVDNNFANIQLVNSDYNLVEGNLCRAPTIGTTLTALEPIGETEIAVTNIAGFEVGMGVVIDLGGVNVEYHRISAISGGAPGVITIDAGLTNAQAAGETIDVPEADYGINITSAASENNIVKGNHLHDSGKTAALNDAGTNTIFDQVMHSIALDLTGGAIDIEVFFAKCPCILAGYSVLYSVATGGGAGVAIRVGRYQAGVPLDDVYFDTSDSELNMAKGYSKHFASADLTQTVIATGDAVTVGTAGGKLDTGEVIVVLQIAEMAD